jgi:hypothetical protein
MTSTEDETASAQGLPRDRSQRPYNIKMIVHTTDLLKMLEQKGYISAWDTLGSGSVVLHVSEEHQRAHGGAHVRARWKVVRDIAYGVGIDVPQWE